MTPPDDDFTKEIATFIGKVDAKLEYLKDESDENRKQHGKMFTEIGNLKIATSTAARATAIKWAVLIALIPIGLTVFKILQAWAK